MPAASSSSAAGASGSSGGGGSKLSADETKLYNRINKEQGRTILLSEIETLFPDWGAQRRRDVLNGLQTKGLTRAEVRRDGELTLHAVAKAQAQAMGKLTREEQLVYTHIRDAGNQGLWSKHIKDKCQIHQTVATKCLKQLETLRMVKVVRDVKVSAHLPVA